MNASTNRRNNPGTRILALMAALLITVTTLAAALPRAEAEAAPIRPSPTGEAPNWDPTAALANGILAKLGGDGLDLVLNQIGMGDKTPQKLDEIKAQLTMIQQHLDEMEDRLAHAIAMNHYSDEVHKTDHTRTQIENTFKALTNVAKQAFVVRDAQDALAKAKTDEDRQKAQIALTAATSLYGQRVDEFKASYKDEHIADALGDMNKMLYPYAGSDDLVIAYRNVILSDGDIRFLTKAHSESLRTVYTYFEDYESLAAWMTGEYNAAIKLDNTDLSKTFNGYITDQRSKLPTMIPDGAVLDLGQHPTTTHNKNMWLAVDGTYTWQSGDTRTGGVWAKIAEMNNTSKPLGLNQWRMPSQADFGQLFAKYTGGSSFDYLKGLGLKGLSSGQKLWDGDVTIQQSPYYWDDVTNYIDSPTHVFHTIGGGSMGWDVAPMLPTGDYERTRDNLQQEIDGLFATAKAGMLTLSDTGAIDYL